MAFPDFIRTSVGKNIRARVTGHSLKGLNSSGTSISHKQQNNTARTSFQNTHVLKQSHLQSHALTDLPHDHPQHIKRRGRALAAPGVAAPAREAVTSRGSTDSDDAEEDHFDASHVTQLAAQLSSGAANGSMPPLDTVPISQILAPVQVRLPEGMSAHVVLRCNLPSPGQEQAHLRGHTNREGMCFVCDCFCEIVGWPCLPLCCIGQLWCCCCRRFSRVSLPDHRFWKPLQSSGVRVWPSCVVCALAHPDFPRARQETACCN